ncbi:hypothetical protein N9J60_05335 [Alphaproteobacteria bacterium]|nr:hypothetical protein [Alphaproteobacteria bacterium]
MNEKEQPISSPKKNIAGELILPFCALLFTLYYFSTVIESPWTAQVNAFMVGSVLIGVIVIFFITRTIMLLNGKAQLHLNVPRILSSIKTRQSGFIGLTIAYLLVIESIGFTLTTGLFFWGSMLLLDYGRAPVLKGALAVFMALAAYGIFILGFETRLPKGVFEAFLTGVF